MDRDGAFEVHKAEWSGLVSAPDERHWLLAGRALADITAGMELVLAGRRVRVESIATYGRQVDLLSAMMTGTLIVSCEMPEELLRLATP